jgi:hypothetical protein
LLTVVLPGSCLWLPAIVSDDLFDLGYSPTHRTEITLLCALMGAISGSPFGAIGVIGIACLGAEFSWMASGRGLRRRAKRLADPPDTA